MYKVESIQTFDQIKLLVDSRRMEIVRLLMAAPATLSQRARVMRQSPAWIRHHIKLLEAAHLVEIAEVRRLGTVTEKYYRTQAGAFLLQEVILPKGKIDCKVEVLRIQPAQNEIASKLSPPVFSAVDEIVGLVGNLLATLIAS